MVIHSPPRPPQGPDSMPYSPHIASYPASLVAAAEAVLLDRKTIRVDCGTPLAAARLRHKVYGLRFAYLHKNNEKHRLHSMAGGLFARVECTELVVMPADQQPDEKEFGQALQDAIAKGTD